MALPDYEYVALQQISHNGVLAYNPGDLVPADNVQVNGYVEGVQVALRGEHDVHESTGTDEDPADPVVVDDGAAAVADPPA